MSEFREEREEREAKRMRHLEALREIEEREAREAVSTVDMRGRLKLYRCPACGAELVVRAYSLTKVLCECGYSWSGIDLEDERERSE